MAILASAPVPTTSRFDLMDTEVIPLVITCPIGTPWCTGHQLPPDDFEAIHYCWSDTTIVPGDGAGEHDEVAVRLFRTIDQTPGAGPYDKATVSLEHTTQDLSARQALQLAAALVEHAERLMAAERAR